MGEKRKMRGSIVLSIGIFFCLFSSGLSEAQERAGRIFYVTTTTSVSTVNTVSFCHFLSVTDTAIVTCAARKRRMLRLNDQPSDAPSEEINPSVSDIESSQEDVEERHGRFVNYWITTTFTSTTTSFTSTGTIGSILCTPIGYTFNNCPGQTQA